jgi:hypothetical protein
VPDMSKNNKLKQTNDKLKNFKLTASLFFLIQAMLGFFYFLKPKKIKKYFKGQKREIKELITGQENFSRFLRDSKKLLSDYFIPSEGNFHKPKALRPKSLLFYAIIAILIKIIVTGVLFFNYPSPAYLAEIISENIINLVNKSRQENGAAPLILNQKLNDFALEKAGDMISRNYFAHETPEGKKPWQWINRSEYDYVYAGENLAMDFVTAETVHEAFMKSPAHRKNILNPNYKEMGVAVFNGSLGGHQTILLVEFFATQRKDISPSAEIALAKTESDDSIKIINDSGSLDGQGSLWPQIAGQENIKTNILAESDPGQTGGGANNQLVSASYADIKENHWLNIVIRYANVFLVALMIYLILTLALNIFIKIRIQNPAIILQSLAVIALLGALLLTNLHFAPALGQPILIL